MIRQLVVLAGLIGLAAATASGADTEQGEKDKLKGTWAITSVEVAGTTTTAPEGAASYTFDKDKVVMKDKGRPDMEGTYTIDASKTPKQLTATGTKDKEVMEAIYELTGDTLKIAYSIEGPKGKRPTAFDPKVAVIFHLKREKR